MYSEISLATARNWDRLNIDMSLRLTARANKRLSKKIILPTEYFINKNNEQSIREIVSYILDNKIDTFCAIYTVAKKLLQVEGIYDLPHVQKTLSSYKCEDDQVLSSFDFPLDERDLLGLIYQSVSFEGEKNRKGSYYTPYGIVKNMLSCVSFANNEKFLDPCCGSGSFLISLTANPSQLYGVDNDPIAVFICKVNLLLKYKTVCFIPQIYCLDFLQTNIFSNIRFDYIITNPPWGAVCKNQFFTNIVSNESFSCFFVKAFFLLNENGKIRFLFPESILNVKVHKDIRLFMLKSGNIQSITLYDGMFTGVTTHYVDIEMSNNCGNDLINIYASNKTFIVNKESFYTTENLVFNFQNNIDSEIIDIIKHSGLYTLKDSVWALGVVTGDNKKTLLSAPTRYTEPIYTGKEILPYVLKKPVKHIIYDRNSFQQVAKEEFYRAKEKLVYKFISNKLVFAYDNTQSLFLNSANILIPKIPSMSIKTVLAFLNSELYQYLYCILFSEIKILKGNLSELPFPNILESQDQLISSYVQKILEGDNSFIPIVDDTIYELFGITPTQKKYIKEYLNGRIN